MPIFLYDENNQVVEKLRGSEFYVLTYVNNYTIQWTECYSDEYWRAWVVTFYVSLHLIFFFLPITAAFITALGLFFFWQFCVLQSTDYCETHITFVVRTGKKCWIVRHISDTRCVCSVRRMQVLFVFGSSHIRTIRLLQVFSRRTKRKFLPVWTHFENKTY